MKSAVRALAAITLSLFATGVAHADKAYTLTTINCTGPTLSTGVYAYDFSLTGGYFTLYLRGSLFNEMTINYFESVAYDNCILASVPRTSIQNPTIMEVDGVGVGIDVGAGDVAKDTIAQTYTKVIFKLAGSITNGKVIPAKAALSQEQEERALEAYKARTANLLRR